MDYCCTCLSQRSRSGDQIEIDVEDQRIFLNREEFKLPFIDTAFTEMIRSGGICLDVSQFMIQLFSYLFVPKDGHLCLTLFLL